MEAEIKAAVEWWAARLAEVPKKDNGDSSPVGNLTSLMATANALDAGEPTDLQLEAFKLQLTRRIAYQLSLRETSKMAWLNCDYAPCTALYESALAADMGHLLDRFPWKTSMHVRADDVVVSHGYGAAPTRIYATL